MGWGSKLKKAVKKVANVTVKAPIKLIKNAPNTIKQVIKNPTDFKSFAGMALINTTGAQLLHQKENAILGAVGGGAAYLTGATAAAEVGAAAGAGAGAGAVPSGSYLAGAGAAAGTGAGASAGVGVGVGSAAGATAAAGTYLAQAGTAAQVALVGKAKELVAQKIAGSDNAPAMPAPAPSQASNPLSGVSTGTLITGAISLLSLITVIANR